VPDSSRSIETVKKRLTERLKTLRRHIYGLSKAADEIEHEIQVIGCSSDEDASADQGGRLPA